MSIERCGFVFYRFLFMSNKMLTAENLRGVWAFVLTPWDEKGRLDEDALGGNVAYQCGCGVHGIYTTSSSGEFFAMDFDEFSRLVDICTEEAKKANMPIQIGCGGVDTKSIVKQAEYACVRGADAIQVIFPYYTKLTIEEAVGFFKDVAEACGDVPLVHYNTSYAKLTLGADDYLRLADCVPTLIGTKLTKGDPLWFTNVCQKVPGLSHFSGEYTFVADFVGGAKGIYSWLAVTNPSLTLRWYEACVDGDWNRAIEIQRRVNLYKVRVKSKWHGTSNAAINKTDAVINPNIKSNLTVRAPYKSCTLSDVEAARRWAKDNFSELLEL